MKIIKKYGGGGIGDFISNTVGIVTDPIGALDAGLNTVSSGINTVGNFVGDTVQYAADNPLKTAALVAATIASGGTATPELLAEAGAEAAAEASLADLIGGSGLDLAGAGMDAASLTGDAAAAADAFDLNAAISGLQNVYGGDLPIDQVSEALGGTSTSGLTDALKTGKTVLDTGKSALQSLGLLDSKGNLPILI